jgi:hypothetical protein
MSSNVFSPIQTLGFGLKQIWQKKPSELFDKGFWTRRMITAKKGTHKSVARNLVTANWLVRQIYQMW